MLLGVVLGLAWIRAVATTLSTPVRCNALSVLKEVRFGGGGGERGGVKGFSRMGFGRVKKGHGVSEERQKGTVARSTDAVQQDCLEPQNPWHSTAADCVGYEQ